MKIFRNFVLALLLAANVANASVILVDIGKGGNAAPYVPAPPGENIYPPTTPVALTCTASEGASNFKIWPSISAHDGVNVGPGVAEYDVEVDGTITSVLSSGISANIRGPFTAGEVGSITPDPTLTRVNGVEYELTSGGGAVEATGGFNAAANDRVATAYQSWTTGSVLTVELSSFTTPAPTTYPEDYNFAGAWVRNPGLDTNDAVIAVGHWVHAVNKGVQVIWRTSDGVNRAAPIYSEGNGSLGKFHIEQDTVVNTTWRVWSQASGGPLVLQQTITGVTISSGIYGMFNAALTSNISTARFSQIAARSAIPITHTINDTTSHTVRFRARDTNLANSGWSGAQTCQGTVGPPPSVGTKKFSPGLWPQTNFSLLPVSDTSYWDSTVQPFIDNVCTKTEVKGCQFVVYWGSLESTAGNFTSGDALFDKLYAAMAAINKPFFAHLWPRKFGSSNWAISGSSVPVIPQDIIDSGNTIVDGTLVRTANLSHAATNSRYIALWQHLGTRYNAKKYFHGIETEETADGAFDGKPGWSGTERNVQWHRFLDEIQAYFPNSPPRINVNFFGPSYDQTGLNAARTFVAAIYSHGYGLGGPDMYTHVNGGATPSWGECIGRGMGNLGSLGVSAFGFSADCGSIDYRGKMSMAYHNESINGSSRATLWNYHLNSIKNTHLVWSVVGSADTDQNDNPISSQNWFNTGPDPFYTFYGLQAAPRTAVTCPENLVGQCSPDWGSSIWEPTRFIEAAGEAANDSNFEWSAAA